MPREIRAAGWANSLQQPSVRVWQLPPRLGCGFGKGLIGLRQFLHPRNLFELMVPFKAHGEHLEGIGMGLQNNEKKRVFTAGYLPHRIIADSP